MGAEIETGKSRSTQKSGSQGALPNTTKTVSVEFIPQPSADFVATTAIEDLTARALAYLNIGYAVHLSGPAGTGKTTLALHIAAQLGRPCTLLHGDDEMRGSDLVGRDVGYRKQSVRDNYVSSILKTEETVSVMWSSNRLTTACEQGHTLIYDEFTRSPATANNALLSVLEEGILNIPSSGQEKGYVKVHSNFRAIFTSNPEEYVGVHKSQDALLDRMITLEVDHHDRETEVAILTAKSKRNVEESMVIVDIVRAMREKLGGPCGPTIRAALAIANIVDFRGCAVDADDRVFHTTCQDLLYYNANRQSGCKISRQEIQSIVQRYANRNLRRNERANAGAADSASSSVNISKTLDKVERGLQRLNQDHSTTELRSAQPVSKQGTQNDAQFADPNKVDVTQQVYETVLELGKIDDAKKEPSVAPLASNRSLPKPPEFERIASSFATRS